MRLAIIESPFRHETAEGRERYRLYRLCCIRNSIIRGESPYASHHMLTEALNDEDPGERDLGIRCGYVWWRAASVIAFYTDFGWSEGMRRAYRRAKTMSIQVEERSINDLGKDTRAEEVQ